MQINLFNVEEFNKINNLQEVTSPILFQNGNIPHPDGLVSNRIFGVTVQSRKTTFAYINLHKHFFSPIIYKAIRRMFRNIDGIVNGTLFYSIDKDGYLVQDENGQTGIDFLYDNWKKIKWSKTDTIMRNERVDLLNNFKRDEIFMQYLIVIPPFYRDIKTNNGGSGETGELNKLYSSAIRYAALIRDKNAFAFQLYNTDYSLQNVIIDIYDYFKTKLEKKNGLLRKYLLGKNVDFATRTVITAPTYHANKPDELMVDFRHAAIPVPHICSLCYPFIVKWVKDFLDREIFQEQHSKSVYDPITDITKVVELDKPESVFSDKWIKKTIDMYIRDPESRFDKIEVPVKNSDQKFFLTFSGKRYDATNTSEISNLITRPLTVTDILYCACVDVTKNRHAMVTRYPLIDEFGVFIVDIRVLSTTETMPVIIGERIYKWYPVINFDTPKEKLAVSFIDSVQFSNSYLEGIGGDYDGDQTTIKILYTQEANEECINTMNSKSYFVNAAGKNIRTTGAETMQTFYVLTKDAPSSTTKKVVAPNEVSKFVNLNPNDITFEYLVDLFGNCGNVENKPHNTGHSISKYNPTDIVVIKTPYLGFTGRTTLGRLIFNKLIVEYCGFNNILDFVNEPVNKKQLGKIEQALADALKVDKITVDQMVKYIDMRDWFGLQLHAVICTSFTMNVIKEPKDVVALKKKLVKEHESELKAGDARAAELIEKSLIAKTKEVLKDDVGLDLYISGARGSIDNNMKNINMMRGPVKNVTTGGFDILTSSLMDGIDKEHMEAHSNSILIGAYSKSVETWVPGYMTKQLIAAMQTERLDEHGTDCGTEKTLQITITPKNKNDYLDRYIVENGTLKCLEQDVIDKYVGKTVRMRSPMYCIGDKLCNKCAGEMFYRLNKPSIGLVSTRVSNTLVNLGMKKFHDQTLHTQKVDINKILL